jgi:threonyl-tRNA synthetase
MEVLKDLLEYYRTLKRKYPLWLSPNQIKIMTLNESVDEYAKEVYQKLFDAGFEVELDNRNESIGKKAMEARNQRFNYLVTIGEKEKSENKIAVKKRDSTDIVSQDLEEFISKLKEEIN